MATLPPSAFERYDEEPDGLFYDVPRFVTHIDDRAVSAVTHLYREYFPAGGDILDLMSSWVSHFPPEVAYRRVVGLGMNADELAYNPCLNEYLVQDLNTHPRLPFDDGTFDGVAICVSIQYLTRPVEVLRETARVLKNGSSLVVTFSNRCFPTKAVALWQSLDDPGHLQLVTRYLRETNAFTEIESLDRSVRRWGNDPLYAVVGRSSWQPVSC
ncbi:MAG: methyltransferase domain-containing protein [Chloroflexota bacterium]|nr:methyltransferase domain-containing protein [Chloroflexota bacterium]